MKTVLYIIFAAIICCVGIGFYIKPTGNPIAEKLIGSSIVGLFLVWMPLFIYHRYKGKDVKKYMITDDFFEKIKNEADTFIDKK